MPVGGDGAGGEVTIELFRAELQTDFRLSFEMDGPREAFDSEADFG